VTGGIKRNPDKRRLDAAGIERKTIGWEYVHVAVDVDRPRFGGQAVFMPLFLLSFSRTRPVSGSRVWSGA
jgi:hypothetical protein